MLVQDNTFAVFAIYILQRTYDLSAVAGVNGPPINTRNTRGKRLSSSDPSARLPPFL